jgi:hypothetical protein
VLALLLEVVAVELDLAVAAGHQAVQAEELALVAQAVLVELVVVHQLVQAEALVVSYRSLRYLLP